MGERRAGPPPFCEARKIHHFYIYRGPTVRYKEGSARGSMSPPSKPRAGFSARHPSKATEHPQPANF